MQTSVTPGALEALEPLGGRGKLLELLARHNAGDWGDIDPHDRRVNYDALKDGSRLMSVYKLDGTTIYIITDGATNACERCWTGGGECPGLDQGEVQGGVHWLEIEDRRITTTVLLPEEY
jgi:hypothetical protein